MSAEAAYDALAQFARYQEKLTRKNITKALAPLDGAHFPWCLPGIREGEYFLFGDMLGFHAVAMIPDTDREPKAARPAAYRSGASRKRRPCARSRPH